MKGGFRLGGALFSFNGGGRYVNCIFEKNNSLVAGGAAYLSGSFIFERCLFRQNTSQGQGGAIDVESATNFFRFRNCVFANNTAVTFGGAIVSFVQDMRVEHCTFLGNSAPTASCIRTNANPQMRVTNSIFWGNTGSIFVGTTPVVRKCIVEGGFASGTGIINQNPNFKDAIGRIFACSPAVDAADTLTYITKDFDNNQRPFDANVDGIAKWDIGAFEVRVPQVLPPSNPIIGDLTPCLKSRNSLYRVTTDNTPASSYTWTLSAGGAFAGTNVNDSVFIDWGATLGSYVLSVVETNGSSGCKTTNTITLVPDPVPTATITPTGFDSICTGDSLLITGSGTGVARQWLRNRTIVPGQTTTQVQAKLAGVWNMRLTDANGCSDTAAVPLKLYLRPLPVVNLTTNVAPEICFGSQITITGTSGQSHRWFRNSSLISGATSNSYTTGQAGSYNMEKTDAFGCRNVSSAPVVVVVNPLPIVSVNPNNRDTICIGDTLNIAAIAGGISSYSWHLNGAAIPSSNLSTWPANVTGHYNVSATDTNGCSDTAAVGHTLIVNDFVPPVALCRAQTIYLNSSGNANLVAAQINNGSSDNCEISSFLLSKSTFNCSNLGSNSVLLIPVDPAGNRDTCIATVTVLDTIRPSVVCSNATVYLNSSGQLTLLPSVVGGASSDNCNITSSTIAPNTFICADTGSHVVTYTGFDQSGNSAQCTATIILEDSTRPIAACIDTLVYLDAFGNASITASSVENGSTDNCGISGFSVNRTSFTCTDVPGATVTVTVSDISGNVSSCNAYVRVVDSVAPVAMCHDTTIYIYNTGASTLSPANIDNGSSDNCIIDSIWLSQNVFTCLDTGANNIILSIIDADTNLATCISIITVLDTVPPTAACTDTTFYLDAFGQAIVDPYVFGVNSFDNCNFFDTAYVNVGPFACVDSGQYTVSLYVVDVNLRIDSCTGTVTIADSLPPFVMCQNISAILNPSGNVSITTSMIDAGTVDNCTLDTVFIDKYNFNCTDVGANTVTLTAIDIFGNTSNCQAVVDVIDTVPPVAICRSITVYLNSSGQAQITGNDINNGSTDNCAIDTLFPTISTFTCSQTGPNLVTLIVQDEEPNIGQCNSTVTVLDTIRPTAICQNDTAYLDQNGSYTLLPATIGGSSFDNCSIVTQSLSQSLFSCTNIGVNSITLTLTDPSGNTSSCTSNLTILDSLAPIAICTDTTFYLNASGSLSLTTANVAGNSSDNCGISTSSLSQSTFSCADRGINLISATFADASGNTSSCSLNLTVLDTVAPTVACLNPTIYLNGSGTVGLTVAQVNGGATDACGISTRTISQNSFVCGDIGANTVTLVVTDSSGNSRQCNSIVTVLDTIPPQVSCTTATVFLDSTGNYLLNPAILIQSSTDVCTIDTSFGAPFMFNCTQLGANTVMMHVLDPSGNADSCQTTLTVRDNIHPVAICDSVELQLDSAGTAILSPLVLGALSFDNCGIDSMVVSQTNFDCGDNNWVPVTLTLFDGTGNISNCIGQVRTIDTSGVSIVNVDLGPDTTACNGSTLTLNAGPGMASYIWSTGATTQSITVSTANTYAVSVTSLRGCTGSDSVVVSTFNTPNPNLRSESGELVVCINDTLQLLVDPVFSQYLWSTGETTSAIDITTGGNYSVSVTDANGCSLLRSVSVTFAPFPAPNPVITPPGPLGMCENTSLILDAGSGYYAYLWTTGQTQQTITAFIPNTYGVQVWNGFGCHSTAQPVVVTQLNSPYPDINQSGDTLFTTTIGQSYQWYIGTVAIPGAINARYIATMNGSYSVRVFYANGCDEISNSQPFIVGAKDPLVELANVVVYPNPSNGIFSLQAASPIRKSLEIRVTDIYGKLIYETSQRNLIKELELDLRGHSAGIYLLELESEDGLVTKKLIIE